MTHVHVHLHYAAQFKPGIFGGDPVAFGAVVFLRSRPRYTGEI